MGTRIATVALMLVALGAGLGGQSPGQAGQAVRAVPAAGATPPVAGTPVLVTSDSTLHLQAWRAGAQPESLALAWEARPRSVDAATWTARRAEAVVLPRDGPLTVADVDGDGQNDLLAVDGFGLTVYGRTPAYYRFERFSESGAPNMAAGDLDGDRVAEVVFQRRVLAGTAVSRDIEVVTLAAGRLQTVARHQLPGFGTALAVGDATNDGRADIVTAGNKLVTVLSRQADGTLTAAAEFANAAPIIAPLLVADVNRDGRNELLVGSAGTLTIHEARVEAGRVSYPVVWRSPLLVDPRVTGAGPAGPTALTQAIAVGDVTGDRQADVVLGVLEIGRLDSRDIRAPRIHVFSFDGQRAFTSAWTSDPLALSMVSAIAIGDLDGDGANEFVVNGRELFRRDAAAHTFRSASTGCASCTDGVIGTFGALAEPMASTRVVPLYWDLQGRQIYERQTASVTLTLLNPFAEAKDVAVTVTSANPRLAVAGGVLRVPAVGTGGMLALPPFSLTAIEGSGPGSLQVEITAAGGYRQVVPVPVYVAPALPTYQADFAGRFATASANAQHENRRVLVMWGSNAEQPSQDLILTMMKTPDLAHTLQYEYELVRAEFTGNEAAAATFKAAPATDGLPYLTVLDAHGALLANHPAAPFKATGTGAAAWDGRKLNETLAKYTPPYVDAEPLLTAALDRAKRENKTLFLWFNAPW